VVRGVPRGDGDAGAPRDGSSPTLRASIAREPGFDAAKIALFLLDPHPQMPDMGLSRSDAADLAAYIARLK
jgi:mono/diheme cytochrome c family protein